MTSPGAARIPPLVGRDTELAELVAWMEDGPAALPRLAVVEGEAGIGKTTLVMALAQAAQERNRQVEWANGVEDAGVPPYWLWRQVTSIEPGGDRYVYFQQLRDHLLSGEPRLVVIDDVQWADEPSLHALRHLLRQRADSELLVCATRRTGDSGAGWDRLGPEIVTGPSTHRFRLNGIDGDAAGALLQAAAGRSLSDQQIRQGTADSGGNPLFLRELGRLLASGGTGTGRDLAELIDIRVRRLSPAAQKLLRSASIMAEEWELAVVARLVEQPAAACLAAVDETVAVGLVTTAGPGRFRFSHGLVRTVLAGQLPLQQSVTLHQRAAIAIEDLHQSELTPALAEIARHWAAAAISGDREPAVDWSRRAAAEAMRASAYEEAVRLCTLALEAAGPSLAPAEKSAILVARAAAAIGAGRLEDAYEDCRKAVGLARSQGMTDRIADAALCLDAIGDRRWDRSVLEWCNEALADPSVEPARRARLLARLAEACVYSGQFADGIRYATAALPVAEETGDPDALIAALRARQLTLSGPEHTDERAVLARRMTDLGKELRRPQVEMWGRLWAMDTMWEYGDLAGVAAEISKLRWCVEEVGTPTARWHLLVSRATLAQARGEFGEAMGAGREAFELMLSMGHPAAVGAFMALATSVGHHRGQDELTRSASPTGAPPDTGEVRNELFAHLGPALAMADAGHLEEAVRAYRRPGPPQDWDIPPYFYRQALQAGTTVAIAAGFLDDVRWFKDQLEGSRERHVAGGAGAANYMGPIELWLGRCEAALGDLDAAVADLESAVRICAAAGTPGFEVESAVELASVLEQRRQNQAARRLLQRVRPTALRLGMTPWVERIDAALNRPDDRLSGREREVAQLVARGMSNREIAASLIVSERTAANHVQHILTKLGFVNRSQIAAWITANE